MTLNRHIFPGNLTAEECRKYLHRDDIPDIPSHLSPGRTNSATTGKSGRVEVLAVDRHNAKRFGIQDRDPSTEQTPTAGELMTGFARGQTSGADALTDEKNVALGSPNMSNSGPGSWVAKIE